ncbi:MAG: alpha amylase C-terminal domain-containing protein [Bacteroidales bacterium]|nr:alpha amylase C-terminal domain-containing protein [Bacteroidales bacterium]
MSSFIPPLAKNDPWLEPYSLIISERMAKAGEKEKQLTKPGQSLEDFATGYMFFGLQKSDGEWIFREWAPNAEKIFLIGDFNNWQEIPEYAMLPLKFGNWEIILPTEKIHHKDRYKLSVYWKNGHGYRLPSYANRVVQDNNTKNFDAQVWHPENPYAWEIENFNTEAKHPFIYEAHIGMATQSERIGTFEEFRLQVLPRIVKAGYNTIQLMGIQEHPYYGSFGYHVSNFFAVSSRFGEPEDLKRLIDVAHKQGITVIMDLVHSHAVKNELEGLGLFDGTDYQYFHDGPRRNHIAWDSLCFNYGKNEVLHFLLSNCKYWLHEYKFDGFRFDGVTSMLYYDHGLSRDFTNYSMYFDRQQDEDAITYLKLANTLIHRVNPNALSVAEEMSGMPGIAAPVEDGGFGFDFRLAMGIPDYWIKIIKELPDEQWNVNAIFHELTSRRMEEKTISYTESHDQALVGDKTIIFRLMDKDMYFFMDKKSQNLTIDRGIALHKILRLITLSTCGGGYLNFMGNEFGHPEWIDFPREGNNWSYKYARRQWNLLDDESLRYYYLAAFDRDMLKMAGDEGFLDDPYCYQLAASEYDQVLAFQRKDLIFIFNLNPGRSFTDYGIKVKPGRFKIILNTDSVQYGGYGNIDETITYYPQRNPKISGDNILKLYIPSRVGLVLKHIPTPRVY